MFETGASELNTNNARGEALENSRYLISHGYLTYAGSVAMIRLLRNPTVGSPRRGNCRRPAEESDQSNVIG